MYVLARIYLITITNVPFSIVKTTWHRYKSVSYTNRSTSESILYLIEVRYWTPAFSNKTLVSDIKIKHIHCVVNGFNLAHLSIIKNISNTHVYVCMYVCMYSVYKIRFQLNALESKFRIKV